MKTKRRYTPGRGDIVWLNFDPQTGHEQAGRRPALILSPKTYNNRSALALACPITSRVKGYSFEVRLPDGLDIAGVVLADQIKSVDWASRQATLVCRIPVEVQNEVIAKIKPLID